MQQKSYAVMMLPVNDESTTIEIPKDNLFDDWDMATQYANGLINDAHDQVWDFPKKPAPASVDCGNWLVQIWLLNVPVHDYSSQ